MNFGFPFKLQLIHKNTGTRKKKILTQEYRVYYA